MQLRWKLETHKNKGLTFLEEYYVQMDGYYQVLLSFQYHEGHTIIH